MAAHGLIAAARPLARDKGFTAAAFLTLALCIAANVVLFAVVHSVLFKPLPVPESDRLVLVYNSYPGAGAERGSSGVPDYYDRVRGMTAVESLALYDVRNRSTGEPGRPERLLVMEVTPSLFRVARVRPEIGRTFTEAEGEVGHDDKVVLTHAYWQQRFGGDPRVLGRSIRLDGRLYTIVGVMPAGFEFLEPSARAWTPLAFTPEQKSDQARHNNSWTCIGRLREGATTAQAEAQARALNAASLDLVPALRQMLVNTGFHTRVVPLQDDLVRDVKGRLYLLWGGTLLVLLIGCVNVVDLALVRARSRSRDLATRLALGAGRADLARQFFSESLLLTGASGAAGLLVGWAAVRALTGLDLTQIPRGTEIALGPVPVLFAVALSLLLGLVLGAFPLAAAWTIDVNAVLHESGRTGTGGRGPKLLRRSLVVTQVALAFVLLVGTGLLLASFRQILAVDPGFDPRHVLTACVRLPASRYAGETEIRGFTSEALRRLRAVAGVAAAGAIDTLPLSGDHSDSVIFAEGYQMKPGESVISPTRLQVAPGYFEAMRIPLVHGRYFDDRDTAGAPPVIIVDTRLARRFWPGENPVGRRMYRPDSAEDLMGVNAKTRFLTVVGVVGEVRQDDLAMSTSPVGAYYLPMGQEVTRYIVFTVRATGDPHALAAPVRAAVAGLDPELPVFDVMTMEEVAGQSLATRRWQMLLASGFGVAALLLSALGIYGVLAYLVTERTREIGIRVAIGATPRSVFDLVMREGLALLAGGLAAGLLGQVWLRRVIASQLYGVGAGDAGVQALAAAVLSAVALAACAMPALRATRVNPVVALNSE